VSRRVSPVLLALSVVCVLAAAGCSAFRGPPQATDRAVASTAPVSDAADSSQEQTEQIDIRRYLGPNYCPELRILEGAELLRRYERGHEDDPKHIVWQASFGETARECLYDQQGGLTLKIGVSGRVIAGPKGGVGDVTIPFKIAVVKYKEAVLATEPQTLQVTIPPAGSTTFTQVREISVPSPGDDRDYIIYVGFDVGEWDLEAGTAVAAVKPPPAPRVEEPPPIAEEPPPAPAEPSGPKVLPTPTGGFVLPR
jgi:hypothetical protein